MPSRHPLQQLASEVIPNDRFRSGVRQRVLSRLEPKSLSSLASGVEPQSAFRETVKDRILRSIRPGFAVDFESLVSSVLPKRSAARRVLPAMRRLPQSPVVHGSLKWAAAFAVFLVIIRTLPVILLAQPTWAASGVQLLPGGEDVTMYIGGVWQPVTEPQTLKGPAMIHTGASTATVVLNDDGVLRLAPNTTIKIQDLSDRPQLESSAPTATLVKGTVWALGLLPPIVDSLTLETAQGTISLNAASASVQQDGANVTIAVYDKGITFDRNAQKTFLVSGERVSVSENQSTGVVQMSVRAFADQWVTTNLSQDAVHRADIARLQAERRTEIAGILPTSIFYPAKRIAEEVDVLFTLTHDGRTEKRIDQANTRLSEALALVKNGQSTEASEPLAEYRDSLVAMAGDQEDNLVKYLIKKQIADAGTTLSAPVTDTEAGARMIADAVAQVGAAIPDADLKPRDIEGYVLVDKLAQINKILSLDKDPTAAAAIYSDIQPYLKDLLVSDTGAHPLLQKEAKSLLVSTSVLLKQSNAANKKVASLMEDDISQYLPVEQEQILLTEEELAQRVSEMLTRIFLFRHPTSRLNQVMAEIRNLDNDPNRGTLLRRLKNALPDTLGEYVNSVIRNSGNELKGL